MILVVDTTTPPQRVVGQFRRQLCQIPGLRLDPFFPASTRSMKSIPRSGSSLSPLLLAQMTRRKSVVDFRHVRKRLTKRSFDFARYLKGSYPLPGARGISVEVAVLPRKMASV
jgi:hypothetical protein